MPIYEYRCNSCGKAVEILQKSHTQKEPLVCPDCGSTEMQRLISSPDSIVVGGSSRPGTTCCGREERCSTPPCSDEGVCRRDR
ncbi:MAG: zinc ribbon domain-containing protein [Candidatus Zixiibacteriota bacterium]